MVHKLDTTHKNFPVRLGAFLSLRESTEQDVSETVKDIVARVRKEGDKAVLAFTEQFDHVKLSAEGMRVSAKEIAAARKACSQEVLTALTIAAKRIRKYHEKQLPENLFYRDKLGAALGWRWNAIAAVGLYVPGGTASYPSSVLMNAIPAQVAGVARLVMVVPSPKGKINPAVLAAADIAGVSEIYRIGGAQAVAALAYGTKTIAPVDKIVGPGNAYVAEAKRQVFGKVGIDMIAGPSEILVVADNKNDPQWIASDLLSQAEHDPMAQAVLITDDESFAASVEQAVTQQLKKLSRSEIATASWKQYGAIILVRDFKEAAALIDRMAPEHVELAVNKPSKLAARIHHAGAIFMGRYTPEAIGDYIAGPSHVLPTSQTARFSSGLGVLDFMKRTSLIECTKSVAKKLGREAATLADAEGLSAHALSLRHRL